MLLQEFVNKQPTENQVIAVVDLASGTKMVGFLEDPNSELNSEGKIKFRWPLEFVDREITAAATPNSSEVLNIGFFRPLQGIPEEYVGEMDGIVTYRLISNFGLAYRNALGNFLQKPLAYKPTMLVRLNNAKPVT